MDVPGCPTNPIGVDTLIALISAIRITLRPLFLSRYWIVDVELILFLCRRVTLYASATYLYFGMKNSRASVYSTVYHVLNVLRA